MIKYSSGPRTAVRSREISASQCHSWPLRDLAGLSHFIAIMSHEYDTFYVINRPTMVQLSENTNVIILVANNISRYLFCLVFSIFCMSTYAPVWYTYLQGIHLWHIQGNVEKQNGTRRKTGDMTFHITVEWRIYAKYTFEMCPYRYCHT